MDLLLVKTLFVLDDNEDTCEVLSLVLADAGYSVVCATSLAEAFRELEKRKVDLIIADLELPTGNGFELLERLRAEPAAINSRTPAMVYSGYSRDSYRQRAARVGFGEYCVKGGDINVLLNTVNRLVAAEAERS